MKNNNAFLIGKHENCHCEFGKLTKEGKYGIPTLEIIITASDSLTVVGRFYLQPFRKYRMQVSGSPSGDGDYGSSPVICYETLKDLGYGVTTSILDSAAYEALYKFIEYRKLSNLPQMGTLRKQWNEYIDECHRWIYGTKSNYIILDHTIEDNTKE